MDYGAAAEDKETIVVAEYNKSEEALDVWEFVGDKL